MEERISVWCLAESLTEVSVLVNPPSTNLAGNPDRSHRCVLKGPQDSR